MAIRSKVWFLGLAEEPGTVWPDVTKNAPRLRVYYERGTPMPAKTTAPNATKTL